MTDLALEVPALVSPAVTVTLRPPGALAGGHRAPQYGLPFGVTVVHQGDSPLIFSGTLRLSSWHWNTRPELDSAVAALMLDVGSRREAIDGTWRRYGDVGFGFTGTYLSVTRYDPISTGGLHTYARLGVVRAEGDQRPFIALQGDTVVRLDNWTGTESTVDGDLAYHFRPAWAGLRVLVGARV